jgi:tRNA dimethylallyltransferase
MGQERILVIAGPTAVGKTELAVRIAGQVPAEIVSADSMAVYQGLDIGTAKPSHEQRARARFHLIDYVPPEEPYSLARFQADAKAAIEGIVGRGHLPILCGGTGLYVRALVQGFELPEEGGETRRREIERRLEEAGLEALAEELVGIDPDAAATVDLRNPRRVVRALEIVSATGEGLAEARGRAEEAPYRAACFVVTCGREVMYRRIDRRVDEMIAAGWVEEVRGLLGRLGPDSTAMQAIGYRHLVAYLGGPSGVRCANSGSGPHGEGGIEETVAAIKRDTRRFAKRQMTWWRKEEGCSWLGWETAQDFAAVEEVLVREAGEIAE